jgi:hypothetical protein
VGLAGCRTTGARGGTVLVVDAATGPAGTIIFVLAVVVDGVRLPLDNPRLPPDPGVRRPVLMVDPGVVDPADRPPGEGLAAGMAVGPGSPRRGSAVTRCRLGAVRGGAVRGGVGGLLDWAESGVDTPRRLSLFRRKTSAYRESR